jgi:hypothetical protein
VRPAPSARGLSLHLGLNAVDPRHYAGWSGDLLACEFDARDMAALATAQKLKPTVISGCQDNQTSLDGEHNGAFTEQLLRVWNEGRFRPKDGTYVNFHAAIKAGMPPTQTPNLFTLGRAAAFARQRPFTI